MSRFAARRARALPVRRQPDPFGLGERTPFEDPRGPGPHGTLPYRQATELLRCIQIMGADNDAYCRHEVLGEPMPEPEFRSVAGISSPVPFRATVAADGSASADIGRIAVTVAPDRNSNDPAMANRAETNFNTTIPSPSAQVQGGRVRNVKVPNPAARITIRTTYGPGASPTGRSAYGRGTTAADVAAGTTSLGFHEGMHGVDFLRFMAANPHPVFTGADGMTVAEFQAARTAYIAAWTAFFQEMEHQSVHGTDCVGNTAAAPTSVTIICGHTHP